MFLFISTAHPWASALSIAFFLLSFLGVYVPVLPELLSQFLPAPASGLLTPLHVIPIVFVLLYSLYTLLVAARNAGIDAQQQQQQHTRSSLQPDELRTLVHRLPLEVWLSNATRARLGVRELRERLRRRRANALKGVLERSELVDALEGCPHETLCGICHEDFVDGEHLRLLPCCHYFHCHCVDRWLLDPSRAPACPLCATVLDTSAVRQSATHRAAENNLAERIRHRRAFGFPRQH